MNDRELNELLQRSRVPERSAEAWQELANTTTDRLRATWTEGPKVGRVAPRPTRLLWRSVAGWAFAGATACALFFFGPGHWRTERIESRNDIAGARKIFAELSAMFPDQLEAVVLDGPTPRLVLSEQPLQNSGVPLFVRLCGAKGCQRVITFSGQRVRLNGETCEVLTDARGNVIVTGEHFIWSSADTASRPGGYRIKAVPLAGIL